jgi:hypothetical protein
MGIGCTGITKEVGNYIGGADFFHPLDRLDRLRGVDSGRR